MKPLQLNLALRYARDGVVHQSPGRVAEENPSRLAGNLQASGEIHLPADGRVVQAPLRAEVADAGDPGVDPDANLERVLDALELPTLAQQSEPLLHLDRHLHRT